MKKSDQQLIQNSSLINDVVSIRKSCVEVLNEFNTLIDRKLDEINFFDKTIIRTVPMMDPSVIITLVKGDDGHVEMFAEENTEHEPPGILSSY